MLILQQYKVKISLIQMVVESINTGVKFKLMWIYKFNPKAKRLDIVKAN